MNEGGRKPIRGHESNLWHISRRPMPGGTKIIDVETRCRHIRLNIQCVSPEE